MSVGWAWRRELKDAGEELPEAVNREDGDSGLQSQELHGVMSPPPPTGKRRQRTVDHTGQVVWWSLNQTNTVKWRRDRDGGKGGQTGRVGTEVTDLNKWKELRLAVGHFLDCQYEAQTLCSTSNCHKLKAETQNNFF